MTRGYNPYDIKFINSLGGSTPTLEQMAAAQNYPAVSVTRDVTKPLVTKQGLKTLAKYAPITGDIYDIGRGAVGIAQGHPYIGASQMGLGVAGLATLGTSSLGKSAVKAGIKGALEKGIIDKALYSSLIKGANKGASNINRISNVLHSKPVVAGGVIIPEASYWASGKFQNKALNQGQQEYDTNGDTGVPKGQIDGSGDFDILDDNQLTGGISIPTNGKLPTQLTGQLPPYLQGENSVPVNQQQANPQAVIDYINQLQKINQPYIDALQKYYNNYDNMLDQQRRAARFWQGAASLSGNPNWARMANYYDPMAKEANKLALAKQVQDVQSGNLNAINEIMGNMAVAELEGLPPEAAFANKNLLTMMAAKDREANKYQIALENNLMKKYGIDRNYARALVVQGMRNQSAENVANIYAGMYGGGVAPGLTTQGTAQQTYNPIQSIPQSNAETAFKQIVGH